MLVCLYACVEGKLLSNIFLSFSSKPYTATISLILTVAPIDVSSSIFLIPHLLAVVVSTWMNVIIFWNRLEERHRESAVRFVRERSQAVLKAVGYR
jgi:hypothetical protein